MSDDFLQVHFVQGIEQSVGIDASTGASHLIYVEKHVYDADLAACLRSASATQRQLRIDIPRCEFFVDGFPGHIAEIPCDLARFCTQCVMAIPLELLLRSGGIVAERRPLLPMSVDVWCNSTITVCKPLWHVCDGSVYDLHIHISVSRNEPQVEIFMQYDGAQHNHELSAHT